MVGANGVFPQMMGQKSGKIRGVRPSIALNREIALSSLEVSPWP